MTVGFYSPLPPAVTGVADYSAALLSALRPLVGVNVNAPGDVCLYHTGNNRLHRDIYRRALAAPGVVVLHDAVLNHFLLGELDRTRYVEEFVFNYGEWSRPLGEILWRDRARSAADVRYFGKPMLRRIAEISRAVIVHNPAAAALVRDHAPAARIYEVPHLLDPPEPVPEWRVQRVRETWNIPRRTFVFGVFGHLRESKRLSSCLRAFESIRDRAGCALLVCGEFASRDLAREMEPRLRAPGIVRLGYAPGRLFWEVAAATDACLNLRYPAAGETSGIAVRLMGAGKPVLLTAGPETSRFPDDACLRVDWGPAETEMLADYMLWLATEPQAAREIGRRAAAHIRERHDSGRVAKMYLDVLNAASA